MFILTMKNIVFNLLNILLLLSNQHINAALSSEEDMNDKTFDLSYDFDAEQSKDRYDTRLLSKELLKLQQQQRNKFSSSSSSSLEQKDSAEPCYTENNIEYEHGEKVTRYDPCEICLCLDGEIFCWWVKCGHKSSNKGKKTFNNKKHKKFINLLYKKENINENKKYAKKLRNLHQHVQHHNHNHHHQKHHQYHYQKARQSVTTIPWKHYPNDNLKTTSGYDDSDQTQNDNNDDHENIIKNNDTNDNEDNEDDVNSEESYLIPYPFGKFHSTMSTNLNNTRKEQTTKNSQLINPSTTNTPSILTNTTAIISSDFTNQNLSQYDVQNTSNKTKNKFKDSIMQTYQNQQLVNVPLSKHYVITSSGNIENDDSLINEENILSNAPEYQSSPYSTSSISVTNDEFPQNNRNKLDEIKISSSISTEKNSKFSQSQIDSIKTFITKHNDNRNERKCFVMGNSYKIGTILPQETGNCLQCICIEGANENDPPRVTCSPHNCPPLILPDLFDTTGF